MRPAAQRDRTGGADRDPTPWADHDADAHTGELGVAQLDPSDPRVGGRDLAFGKIERHRCQSVLPRIEVIEIVETAKNDESVHSRTVCHSGRGYIADYFGARAGAG